MPTRFPGIDPYLETQGYWPDFHSTFLETCRKAIADRLPDHYEARLDERIRLVDLSEEVTKAFRPDLTVINRDLATTRPADAMAVLELEPVTIPGAFLEEVREIFIQILHRPDRKLVAVVELFSPENKCEPGHGIDLAKRNDLYRSQTHLIELDFLNGGHRLPMGRQLPPGNAFAVVGRWDRRPDCEVYAWSIRRPLPKVRFPLLAPDPDIVIDLAEVYATTFEQGRYERSIDYRAPLAIGLNSDDRAWAEALAKSP
jgi:Protein of unknown function (DUF4058)